MEAVFDARSILCLILFHLNSNSPLMFDSKLINLVPGLQFEKGHEPTNSNCWHPSRTSRIERDRGTLKILALVILSWAAHRYLVIKPLPNRLG